VLAGGRQGLLLYFCAVPPCVLSLSERVRLAVVGSVAGMYPAASSAYRRRVRRVAGSDGFSGGVRWRVFLSRKSKTGFVV
jgi:hypothetical protein